MSTELPQVNERGLTEAQEAILKDVYSYSDEADITESDLEIVSAMFDTPEKFKVLRKFLGFHTREERGLTYKSQVALVDTDPKDLQAYALAVQISELADERIRKALVSMYVQVRERNREKMAENFKATNEAEAKEAELSEQFQEEQEEGKREVGENL